MSAETVWRWFFTAFAIIRLPGLIDGSPYAAWIAGIAAGMWLVRYYTLLGGEPRKGAE